MFYYSTVQIWSATCLLRHLSVGGPISDGGPPFGVFISRKWRPGVPDFVWKSLSCPFMRKSFHYWVDFASFWYFCVWSFQVWTFSIYDSTSLCFSVFLSFFFLNRLRVNIWKEDIPLSLSFLYVSVSCLGFGLSIGFSRRIIDETQPSVRVWCLY